MAHCQQHHESPIHVETDSRAVEERDRQMESAECQCVEPHQQSYGAPKEAVTAESNGYD